LVAQATGWTTEKSWFDLWQGWELFFFSRASRPVLGPIQHLIHWLLRVKQLRC